MADEEMIPIERKKPDKTAESECNERSERNERLECSLIWSPATLLAPFVNNSQVILPVTECETHPFVQSLFISGSNGPIYDQINSSAGKGVAALHCLGKLTTILTKNKVVIEDFYQQRGITTAIDDLTVDEALLATHLVLHLKWLAPVKTVIKNDKWHLESPAVPAIKSLVTQEVIGATLPLTVIRNPLCPGNNEINDLVVWVAVPPSPIRNIVDLHRFTTQVEMDREQPADYVRLSLPAVSLNSLITTIPELLGVKMIFPEHQEVSLRQTLMAIQFSLTNQRLISDYREEQPVSNSILNINQSFVIGIGTNNRGILWIGYFPETSWISVRSSPPSDRDLSHSTFVAAPISSHSNLVTTRSPSVVTSALQIGDSTNAPETHAGLLSESMTVPFAISNINPVQREESRSGVNSVTSAGRSSHPYMSFSTGWSGPENLRVPDSRPTSFGSVRTSDIGSFPTDDGAENISRFRPVVNPTAYSEARSFNLNQVSSGDLHTPYLKSSQKDRPEDFQAILDPNLFHLINWTIDRIAQEDIKYQIQSVQTLDISIYTIKIGPIKINVDTIEQVTYLHFQNTITYPVYITIRVLTTDKVTFQEVNLETGYTFLNLPGYNNAEVILDSIRRFQLVVANTQGLIIISPILRTRLTDTRHINYQEYPQGRRI